MKVPYFEKPTQVMYYDYDNEDNDYVGGIAYRDQIICGCCGGIVELTDLFEYTPKNILPMRIFDTWIDLDEEICGDLPDPDEEEYYYFHLDE